MTPLRPLDVSADAEARFYRSEWMSVLLKTLIVAQGLSALVVPVLKTRAADALSRSAISVLCRKSISQFVVCS